MLLGVVGLQELVPPQPTEEVIEEWRCHSSQQVEGQSRKGFNSLVILGA
jgi:hypothetical protein